MLRIDYRIVQITSRLILRPFGVKGMGCKLADVYVRASASSDQVGETYGASLFRINPPEGLEVRNESLS